MGKKIEHIVYYPICSTFIFSKNFCKWLWNRGHTWSKQWVYMPLPIFQFKQKLLLIYSSRCKTYCFHTSVKPFYTLVCLSKFRYTLAFMWNSLCFSISQRNNDQQFLASFYFCFWFAIRHCHPAGIKTKFLTFQHNLLTIISRFFLIIFISDNGNIIFYIFKFSIMSHKGIKTFRFVEKVWMDNLLSALTSLSRSWFLLFSMVRSPDFYTVLRCVFLSWFLIYPSQYPLFRSSD